MRRVSAMLGLPHVAAKFSLSIKQKISLTRSSTESAVTSLPMFYSRSSLIMYWFRVRSSYLSTISMSQTFRSTTIPNWEFPNSKINRISTWNKSKRPTRAKEVQMKQWVSSRRWTARLICCRIVTRSWGWPSSLRLRTALCQMHPRTSPTCVHSPKVSCHSSKDSLKSNLRTRLGPKSPRMWL